MDHATVVEKTYSSLINTSVRLRCHPGHHFSTGKIDIQIRCQDNGEWEDVNDCQGNRKNIEHNNIARQLFPFPRYAIDIHKYESW